jgi:hypothetical protein
MLLFADAVSALWKDVSTLLASPVVALAFIFSVGALGLYMLLPGQQSFSASAVKWFGGPLMLISLVLLAALVGPRVGWWPPIPSGERISPVAFAIPAATSLTAAVLAISARRSARSVMWFAALLASNGVLFLLHGAVLAATGNAILAAGALIAWRLLRAPDTAAICDAEGEAPGGEPFLACLTGALLCVVLVGTIAHATGGRGGGDVDRLGRTMARKRETWVEARSKSAGRDAADSNQAESQQTDSGALRLATFRNRPVTLLAAAALVLSSIAGGACFALRLQPDDRARTGAGEPDADVDVPRNSSN